MMDQLASIGVAFQDEYIDKIFEQNVDYYRIPPKPPSSLSRIFSRRSDKQWAITPIYEKHKPVRPFGLGEIYNSETGIYVITGKAIRTPGLYTRADPETGMATKVAMTHTNERIHCCVRIRLELEGLGPNDEGLYSCRALTKNGPWRLRQRKIHVEDPIPWNASWGPGAPAAKAPPGDLRWVWEYDGPEDDAPKVKTMIEENLGPFQRKLLLWNKGKEFFCQVVGAPEEINGTNA
jgi:hypothetical protein